jgi:hypothetical protein
MRSMAKAMRITSQEGYRMSVRLSAAQERVIIEGIMNGRSAARIATDAAACKGTVVRIYNHIRQTRHYKGFTISGEVPSLSTEETPGRTNTKRGRLKDAIIAVFCELGAASACEIFLKVTLACPLATRASTQNTVLEMLKKGKLDYLNGYYFLRDVPLTDEAARRVQTTRVKNSRAWSKYQTQEY